MVTSRETGKSYVPRVRLPCKHNYGADFAETCDCYEKRRREMKKDPRPAAKPAAKPADKPEDKPVENPTYKPVAEAVAKFTFTRARGPEKTDGIETSISKFLAACKEMEKSSAQKAPPVLFGEPYIDRFDNFAEASRRWQHMMDESEKGRSPPAEQPGFKGSPKAKAHATSSWLFQFPSSTLNSTKADKKEKTESTRPQSRPGALVFGEPDKNAFQAFLQPSPNSMNTHNTPEKDHSPSTKALESKSSTKKTESTPAPLFPFPSSTLNSTKTDDKKTESLRQQKRPSALVFGESQSNTFQAFLQPSPLFGKMHHAQDKEDTPSAEKLEVKKASYFSDEAFRTWLSKGSAVEKEDKQPAGQPGGVQRNLEQAVGSAEISHPAAATAKGLLPGLPSKSSGPATGTEDEDSDDEIGDHGEEDGADDDNSADESNADEDGGDENDAAVDRARESAPFVEWSLADEDESDDGTYVPGSDSFDDLDNSDDEGDSSDEYDPDILVGMDLKNIIRFTLSVPKVDEGDSAYLSAQSSQGDCEEDDSGEEGDLEDEVDPGEDGNLEDETDDEYETVPEDRDPRSIEPDSSDLTGSTVTPEAAPQPPSNDAAVFVQTPAKESSAEKKPTQALADSIQQQPAAAAAAAATVAAATVAAATVAAAAAAAVAGGPSSLLASGSGCGSSSSSSSKLELVDNCEHVFDPFIGKLVEHMEAGYFGNAEGVVYMLADRELPGVFKIGFTARSAETRLKESCARDSGQVVYKSAADFPGAQKVETLVKLSLAHKRYNMDHCSKCGNRHVEWFAVSEQKMKACILTWTAFIQSPIFAPGGARTDAYEKFAAALFQLSPSRVRRALEDVFGPSSQDAVGDAAEDEGEDDAPSDIERGGGESDTETDSGSDGATARAPVRRRLFGGSGRGTAKKVLKTEGAEEEGVTVGHKSAGPRLAEKPDKDFTFKKARVALHTALTKLKI